MRELIEELRSYAKKNYVSDLYNQISDPVVRQALKKVERKDYSIEEWQSAIEYITDGKSKCNSMEDVTSFLSQL